MYIAFHGLILWLSIELLQYSMDVEAGGNLQQAAEC